MEPINMERARQIAFASTEDMGRDRWSELAVYFLEEPTKDGKRWLAVSTGMSKRPGDRTLVDRLCTFSLESALKVFDDNPIGRNVKAQALDWAQHHQPKLMHGEGVLSDGNEQASQPFAGEDDRSALEWLFGPGFNQRHAAACLGLGESTLRMGLAKGHAVKVPLLAILPFVDRERFHAANLREPSDD